jgi:ornithine carbamoyltransferase
LCDKNHPTQAICDLVTIKQKFGKIKGIRVAFVGACNNNVARSLIEGLLSLGAEYIGIGPKDEFPNAKELQFYNELAKKNGGKIKFSTNLEDLKGANVIYQDVFLNLGDSFDLWPERLEKYAGYQLTKKATQLADKKYIYMHCLPAINGSPSAYTKHISEKFGKKFPYVTKGEVEVASDVFYDEKHSVVYEQAVNRIYAIKAIFKAVIKK